MDKNTNKLEQIFSREIDRLNELSKENPLDMDQVDILLKLVKAYGSFKSREQEVEEESTLSVEELEALL